MLEKLKFLDECFIFVGNSYNSFIHNYLKTTCKCMIKIN